MWLRACRERRGGIGRRRVPPTAYPPDVTCSTGETTRVTAEFTRSLGEVVRRLRRWTAASWAVPAPALAAPPGVAHSALPPPGVRSSGPPAGAASRADITSSAVQRLADLAAAAEGYPPRRVPRLADHTLPDQLAVVCYDIARTADPAAVAGAQEILAALRRSLGLR